MTRSDAHDFDLQRRRIVVFMNDDNCRRRRGGGSSAPVQKEGDRQHGWRKAGEEILGRVHILALGTIRVKLLMLASSLSHRCPWHSRGRKKSVLILKISKEGFSDGSPLLNHSSF